MYARVQCSCMELSPGCFIDLSEQLFGTTSTTYFGTLPDEDNAGKLDRSGYQTTAGRGRIWVRLQE